MTADVDGLRQRLLDAGVAVSAPRQFRDIGYLCHLTDPAGFTIELLQHRFEAPAGPLGPPCVPAPPDPVLGLLTLRVRDPAKSLAFYRDELGLTLLSRQEVAPHRFTLYFLAATDERPPVDDIDAVENREWLWQRPYTLLELQHRWGTEEAAASYSMQHARPIGFWGLTLRASDGAGAGAVVSDPDGYQVRLGGVG